MNIKKYNLPYIQLLIFIASIYFLFEETNYLIHKNFKELSLDDNLIIFYLRFLFNFIAVPLFLLSKVFEYIGFLSDDAIEHYQIKLFYNSVYVILTIYLLLTFLNFYFPPSRE